jgi:hypothetical protein
MKTLFKLINRIFCIHDWENTGDPDGEIVKKQFAEAFKDGTHGTFMSSTEHTCRKCGRIRWLGSGVMHF